MKDRLWDTAKNSALTFTLANIPSEVYHVGKQYQNHIAPQDTSNSTAVQHPVDSDIIHTAQLWEEQINENYSRAAYCLAYGMDTITMVCDGADTTETEESHHFTQTKGGSDETRFQNWEERFAQR